MFGYGHAELQAPCILGFEGVKVCFTLEVSYIHKEEWVYEKRECVYGKSKYVLYIFNYYRITYWKN